MKRLWVALAVVMATICCEAQQSTSPAAADLADRDRLLRRIDELERRLAALEEANRPRSAKARRIGVATTGSGYGVTCSASRLEAAPSTIPGAISCLCRRSTARQRSPEPLTSQPIPAILSRRGILRLLSTTCPASSRRFVSNTIIGRRMSLTSPATGALRLWAATVGRRARSCRDSCRTFANAKTA